MVLEPLAPVPNIVPRESTICAVAVDGLVVQVSVTEQLLLPAGIEQGAGLGRSVPVMGINLHVAEIVWSAIMLSKR